MAADTRHTLDALGLGAVVDARSGGQRMVIASAQGPGPAGVDLIGEVLPDYEWKLLASATQNSQVSAVARATRAPVGDVGRTPSS